MLATGLSRLSMSFRFNTASGMRSIAIRLWLLEDVRSEVFQYRKRYEVYCNCWTCLIPNTIRKFQYRKRYEVYCNVV